MRSLKQIPAIAAVVATAALAAPAGAAPAPAKPFVPGEILVSFGKGGEQLLDLPPGVGVGEAAQALRANPEVAYAVPNYLARASAVPNDPGRRGEPGGWRHMQWNFLPCGSSCGQSANPLSFESPGGINAIDAWTTIKRRTGRASGKFVRVAVLDTGIAFRGLKPNFKRSPDFARKQFVAPWDFVDGGKLALDRDGHGTHIAGTIAERNNNGVALTGLAPAAKIIPVRVLNANGYGTARDIARGIVYAAKRGARVINMSFEFSSAVRSCKRIRGVCRAIRFATKRRGALVVAAAGNSAGQAVAFPARAPRGIAVGRTTRDGCVAAASRSGEGLDLVAPGGGAPAVKDCGAPGPDSTDPIRQLTFKGLGFKQFGYPGIYEGTSMAAAHVSGVAAMVISSRVLGNRPKWWKVQCQLKATARTERLGQTYDPTAFGSGLVDAAAAVA